MKIYVDELPQTKGISRLEDDVTLTEVRMWFKTNEDVEIVSLAEHDKQVRKEVCEDLYNKCVEKIWTNDEGFDCVDIDNIKEILDQVQGETK